ncbi:hypothetical protein [Oligoflexus tunisiensis]|uniref:hypothetical protein n=1 Tax=Oligoflexus tunisiensis TaxID=708132 RepID=UPI00114CFF99|nr:hypothetical protein [Oligoflexus tunisiensis]
MGDSKTIALVKDGVRTASLHRLFGPGYALPEMLPPPPTVAEIDDTWLVKIVVSSDPIRIQFKVYYTVDLAKALYFYKHPGSKELPARIYHDFIREFCNLTAGAIKVWLADLVTVMKTDDLVVNLPDQKPAMVEMPPLDKTDSDDQLFDTWVFQAEKLQLLCATEIQVFDWAQVANIQPNVHPADDGSDEIEFL